MLNMRDDIGISKSIDVVTLANFLSVFPASFRVTVCPGLGNLVVWEGDKGDEDNWRWRGTIDLANEDLIEEQ